MKLSQQQIKDLCDSWKRNAVNAQTIAIGGQTEQFRLLNNGIGFHELDYAELRTACVELTKILLLPNLNMIIDHDHIWFWSWASELLLGHGGPLSLSVNREIGALATTVARSALANANPPTREGFERARNANSLLNPHARDFLQNSHVALSYLCFPFLEAVARQACNSYIDSAGIVLQPFARSNGNSYAIGNRCSNVGDVLRLLMTIVACPNLQSDLAEVLGHVAQIGASSDGCSVIFNWRNPTLHGEATFATIGGTLYSLALLIALDGISADYDRIKASAMQRVQQEVALFQLSNQAYTRSSWSYYPPY